MLVVGHVVGGSMHPVVRFPFVITDVVYMWWVHLYVCVGVCVRACVCVFVCLPWTGCFELLGALA